mgnify:CR=1 FL=1
MSDPAGNITRPEMCFGLLMLRFKVTSEIYATVVATSVLNIASGLCASRSNLLVFTVIMRTPSLHTCSNLLLANLCVTDFLVGFIVQPFYVTKKVTELLGKPSCEVRLVYTYFGFLCTCVSMFSLCLVSGERYIAVIQPLTYYSFITKHRVCACVAATWMCWAIVCCLPLAGIPFGIFFRVVFCVIITSFLFMAVVHCPILKAGKRQQRRILATIGRQSIRFRRENKITRTMSLIVGAVVFCYIPQLSLLLTRAMKGDSTRLVHVGDAWADTVVFLNSSFNPFIYCYRNLEIRNAMRRLLMHRRENTLFAKQSKIAPSSHLRFL